MSLKIRDSDGDRFLLWPIRLKWGELKSSCWFQWHGWQVGTEAVPLEQTSMACIPGYRRVFGQTLSIGRFKMLFGPESNDKWCETHCPEGGYYSR